MCRNRDHIDCPHIADYYKELRETYSRDETWQYIKMCLKAMRTFRSGENATEDYIYLEEVQYLQREGTKVFGQEPI